MPIPQTRRWQNPSYIGSVPYKQDRIPENVMTYATASLGFSTDGVTLMDQVEQQNNVIVPMTHRIFLQVRIPPIFWASLGMNWIQKR